MSVNGGRCKKVRRTTWNSRRLMRVFRVNLLITHNHDANSQNRYLATVISASCGKCWQKPVVHEGENYEETSWGQPRWPVFLTEEPGATQLKKLDQLHDHMEEQLLGLFSVSSDAIWKVRESQVESSQ